MDIILDKYKNGQAYTSIAKEIGKSPSFVKRVLLQNGVKIRNISESHEKYFFDKSFFEVIDCELKAYILGFLYADGNVCKNVFQIALHKQDEEFLILLKESLNSSHPIVNDRGYKRFRIGNVELSKKLALLGVVERKTFSISFPDDFLLKKDLWRHFIRGYFDGDGCITFHSMKNGKLKWKFQLTSNFDFLNSIMNIFCQELGFNLTKLRKEPRVKTDVFYYEHCSTSSEKIIKIYNFLYRDSSFFLSRKKNKFLTILNILNND